MRLFLLSSLFTLLIAQEDRRSTGGSSEEHFEQRSIRTTSNKTQAGNIVFPTFLPSEYRNGSTLTKTTQTPHVKNNKKRIPLDFLKKLSEEQDLAKVIRKFVSNVELKEVKGQVYVWLDGKPLDSSSGVTINDSLRDLNTTSVPNVVLYLPTATTAGSLSTRKPLISGHAHRIKMTTTPSPIIVTTKSKFASLLMAPSSQPEAPDSGLFVRFGNNQDSAIKRISDPAICKPELKTVDVPIAAQDLNAVYLPLCVRVERCGGCCISDQLACEPVSTRQVFVQVSKFSYSNEVEDRGPPLKFVSTEEVLVEEHTKCHCNCKIKKEHCNGKQRYDSGECQCVCKNEEMMERCKRNRQKIWDHSDCACKCRDTEECNSGFLFDYETCQCKSLERRHRRQHEQQRRKNQKSEKKR